MTLRLWIIIVTVALCLLAILRLVWDNQWNVAALLAIAVAAFVLDRSHMWEEQEKNDDDQPPD